ncbi:MAG TPA: YfiR family protein [Candidatus Acidoferrum sp.]|nr:YfiR family protein [Candidatus Acidoferrum sp.]
MNCVRRTRSAGRHSHKGGGGGFSLGRKLIRAAVGLVLLATFVPELFPTSAQQFGKSQYLAKANFLAAFPKFIDWPSEAFPSPQAPINLCVFGNFNFGTSLAEISRGITIRGRRLEVRWERDQQSLRTCHILFVSHSEEKRYAKILKAIEGASVLTVGETPDFLASGGAIDFLYEEDRLEFEVNIGAAADAHLRISSSMLALARHVVTSTDAAKNQASYPTRFSTSPPGGMRLSKSYPPESRVATTSMDVKP